jgi:pimeloyl-ACP methyl ester carboxylesterase
MSDRCFTLSSARRLADAFADARLIEVPEATTFVSIDAPDAVAAAILDLR